MILMIDNYDSFTFNIVQYLGELGAEVLVKRNNRITLDEIELLVLSVAKKQLESSFEIHKSIGFIQFLNDNSYIINK